MTLTLAQPAEGLETAQHQLIPIARLRLSQLNARQLVTDDEIGAMADSISTCGLLQNLIGLDINGDVEIVAGGKRLRALQLLAAQGFMPRADTGLDFDRIPVRVTTSEAEALEWAGAENAARSQPHPADEVMAYGKLSARGAAPRQIAIAFAQTEAHVKRRLALASLPDAVILALRADKISLDQASAFTIAGSNRQIEDTLSALLAAGGGYGWDARALRQKLTGDLPGARDKRLIYIGLDAYTAAGGTLTLDLFADHSYVNDPDLLETLAAAKLTARAEELRTAEGWAWARVMEGGGAFYGKFDQLARTPGELSDADLEEYDNLAELAEGGVLDEVGQQKLDALQDRMDGDWTDEDRAMCGLVLILNYQGEEVIRRGLRDRAVPQTIAEDGDDGEETTTAPAPEAGMPQNLRDDLRAIRLLALQAALLENPGILTNLLLWQVSGGDMIPWQMPLAITVGSSQNIPGIVDGLTVPQRLDKTPPSARRQEPTPQAFAAWLDSPADERSAAVASALARAFYQPTGLLSVHLSQMLRPDARALWTPNARNFFGRIPTSMLDAIWADLATFDNDPVHEAFRSGTKKDKAKELDQLFNSADYREALGLSRAQNARIDAWLPEDLRWPEADTTEPDTTNSADPAAA